MATVCSSARLFPDQARRIVDAGHRLITPDVSEPMERDALLANVADAEGLICLLTDRVDRELLGAGRRLKVVANIAVGYENIDVTAARELGIVVTNTPDVLTEATADLTFGLLLAAARRIAEGDAAVRAGDFPAWRLDPPLQGTDVFGATLGVVGLGRIGLAVALRARLGFGMDVCYHSRTPREEAERDLGVRRVSLERLLVESDFVCIHVPDTPETRHLFDAEAFRQMKPTAILINAARGSVVDEGALVDALKSKTIAGAGLDVFENEPDVHPGLLALRDRVVLVPHLGSATSGTRQAMARLAVDNILAVLSGQLPISSVS